MFYKGSLSRRIFVICNSCFIFIVCLMCIYPILNTLAVSLSSKAAVDAGLVKLWPVDFTLESYKYVIKDGRFFRAFGVSIVRVLLGVSVSMVLTVLAGYPLSKTKRQFPLRDIIMWYFVFTMLFSGGLIPTYLVVKGTGLLDNMWALILPNAVNVYNVILLQNYFKGLPEALYESAKIDGAGEWKILYKIILPLSKPILATLTVFITVSHWNAWFDGMIYMNRDKNWPLQTYLRTVVIKIDETNILDISQILSLSSKSNKSAQIFIAMVPVLCVYPFLQKHFTSGIVLGSVKE